MTNQVMLREVLEADLEIFFEHQREPEAVRMAAFPSREREAFMAHWHKIMDDPTVILRTIVFEGQVAGNVVSFVQSGQREVGYWIGKEFWGQGIATAGAEGVFGAGSRATAVRARGETQPGFAAGAGEMRVPGGRGGPVDDPGRRSGGGIYP